MENWLFWQYSLRRFIESDISEVRILSRDEKKKTIGKFNSDKIKFYIVDVRDYHSVLNTVRGVDFVFTPST